MRDQAVNLLEKISAYKDGAHILAGWLGSGSEVVDYVLAQKRANTCIACPKNLAGSKISETVAEAIRETVSLKNDMELVLKEEWRLHECSVCKCQTRLKAWVPLAQLTKYMTKADFETYPTNCYLRTESNL